MQSIRQIVLGLGLLAAANLAQAALITLDGDHFSVTYDTDQLGSYNPGLVSGSQDTVYFQSSSFQAMTPGGTGAASAFLQLTLAIDPGYTFAGLSFMQDGSYYLYGDGSVRVTTDVTLANVDTLDSAALSFDTGSTLDAIETLRPWLLASSLGQTGLGAPQTLLLTLDTDLYANAGSGAAFIQNGYVGFQIKTAPAAVPAPGSLALLLVGGLAALAARRSKTA